MLGTIVYFLACVESRKRKNEGQGGLFSLWSVFLLPLHRILLPQPLKSTSSLRPHEWWSKTKHVILPLKGETTAVSEVSGFIWKQVLANHAILNPIERVCADEGKHHLNRPLICGLGVWWMCIDRCKYKHLRHMKLSLALAADAVLQCLRSQLEKNHSGAFLAFPWNIVTGRFQKTRFLKIKLNQGPDACSQWQIWSN